MASMLVQRAAKAAALVPGLARGPRRGLTVLLYHRVGEGSRGIDLPTASFDEQVSGLAASGRLVSLTEGLERVRSGERSDLVALTFDDGTRDFHTHALPVLVRHRAPATVYVSTAPVDEGAPFPSWSGAREPIPAMTWEHLTECVATGLVTVGSHTHTHADLDLLDPVGVREELVRSRGLIEDRLGVPCEDFAYPHAVRSDAAEAQVRRHYRTAAIAGWRRNGARVDPHRIARVPITRADGPLFFRAKVAGRMSAEALLYRLGGTKRAEGVPS